MTVGELKEIAPMAEAFELKPDVRYIVQLKGHGATPENAAKVAEGLKKNGIEAVVALGNLTFYEISK